MKYKEKKLELWARIREDISIIDQSILGRTLEMDMEDNGSIYSQDDMLELQLPSGFDMSIATFELSCPADHLIYTNTKHNYYTLDKDDALKIFYKYYVEGYQFKQENHAINDGNTQEDIQIFYKKHQHLFRKAKADYLLERLG